MTLGRPVQLVFFACVSSIRSLRLSNINLFTPFLHTSFGTRSFSIAAPEILNSLLQLFKLLPLLTPFVITLRPIITNSLQST